MFSAFFSERRKEGRRSDIDPLRRERGEDFLSDDGDPPPGRSEPLRHWREPRLMLRMGVGLAELGREW